MKCPYCEKEMEIMWINDVKPEHYDDLIHREAVGHCWDCRFDASWQIEIDSEGNSHEYGLQKYFFG